MPRVAPHGAVGRFGRLAFCANGSQADADVASPTDRWRMHPGALLVEPLENLVDGMGLEIELDV